MLTTSLHTPILSLFLHFSCILILSLQFQRSLPLTSTAVYSNRSSFSPYFLSFPECPNKLRMLYLTNSSTLQFIPLPLHDMPTLPYTLSLSTSFILFKTKTPPSSLNCLDLRIQISTIYPCLTCIHQWWC